MTPQQRAIAYVAGLARGGPLDSSLRVTLNFHPDRVIDGTPILEAMARDGRYRSQFETGTSNGGLTAHPGGERWGWESRIFGGAYDDVAAAERPKYGSLNFRRRATGGSPRFGSAHLRLRSEALQRSTFCYPDSVFEPLHFGVAHRMSLIAMAENDDHDLLDDYIEAQVHGPLLLDRDVDAIVLDPCYRDTDVEPRGRVARPAARRHPDYRGPAYVRLGLSLAQDGVIDPRVIGDAARSGTYDEQDLKKVWHYLARFGSLPVEA